MMFGIRYSQNRTGTGIDISNKTLDLTFEILLEFSILKKCGDILSKMNEILDVREGIWSAFFVSVDSCTDRDAVFRL